MGKFYSVNEFEALQYPEMLRIKDMLDCIDDFEKIDQSDFEALCKQWESELTRVAF